MAPQGGSVLAQLSDIENVVLGMAAGICSKGVNYPLLVWKNAATAKACSSESFESVSRITDGMSKSWWGNRRSIWIGWLFSETFHERTEAAGADRGNYSGFQWRAIFWRTL